MATGFRKRSCSTNKLERDDDSKKSHHALCGVRSDVDEACSADRWELADGLGVFSSDRKVVRAVVVRNPAAAIEHYGIKSNITDSMTTAECCAVAYV